MKFTITFKCEKLSPKIFTGEVDLYPVGFRELDHCDARQGYLLGLYHAVTQRVSILRSIHPLDLKNKQKRRLLN